MHNIPAFLIRQSISGAWFFCVFNDLAKIRQICSTMANFLQPSFDHCPQAFH
jgi:hypothetical protein